MKKNSARNGVAHTISVDIRGVVYREGPWWIAHALELDLPAEGDTPEAAIRASIDLCAFQVAEAIKDGDLRSIFRPAPPELWELFARAVPRRSPSASRGSRMQIAFRELAAA